MMFADTDAVADAVDPAVLASGITQIEQHSVGDRRTVAARESSPQCGEPRHRADAEQQFDLVERGTVGMGRIVQHVEYDDALAGIRLIARELRRALRAQGQVPVTLPTRDPRDAP